MGSSHALHVKEMESVLTPVHLLCSCRPAVAGKCLHGNHLRVIRRLLPGQAPLQPLQDNLELQTYETFERDLTKYHQYEAAVLAALRDRVPDAEAATRETVLMVMAARWRLGRRPLGVHAGVVGARSVPRSTVKRPLAQPGSGFCLAPGAGLPDAHLCRRAHNVWSMHVKWASDPAEFAAARQASKKAVAVLVRRPLSLPEALAGMDLVK